MPDYSCCPWGQWYLWPVILQNRRSSWFLLRWYLCTRFFGWRGWDELWAPLTVSFFGGIHVRWFGGKTPRIGRAGRLGSHFQITKGLEKHRTDFTFSLPCQSFCNFLKFRGEIGIGRVQHAFGVQFDGWSLRSGRRESVGDFLQLWTEAGSG